MGSGTREIHKDNEPLATGLHHGATATTLFDPGKQFDVFVAQVGLAIENATTGLLSTIATLTADHITTAAGLTWTAGDTYNIFKTTAKNKKISTEWVDLSRGWKSPKETLKAGWREEDRDRDRPAGGGHKNVFGPGQPERH
jgi:hypothetical protein